MRNKPSPIYPHLGVYAKVCFVYKQVVRNLTKKYLQIKVFRKETNKTKFNFENLNK